MAELGTLVEVPAVRAFLGRIGHRAHEHRDDLGDERRELRRIHFDRFVGGVETDVVFVGGARCDVADLPDEKPEDRKSTRLNSQSH